jgi:hypothetical protein
LDYGVIIDSCGSKNRKWSIMDILPVYGSIRGTVIVDLVDESTFMPKLKAESTAIYIAMARKLVEPGIAIW